MRAAAPDSRRGPRGRHRHYHHYHRGGPLFWRIFLHGLLLIALVMAAVVVVGFIFGEGWWHEADVAARYAADRVSDLRRDPAALTRAPRPARTPSRAPS